MKLRDRIRQDVEEELARLGGRAVRDETSDVNGWECFRLVWDNPTLEDRRLEDDRV